MKYLVVNVFYKKKIRQPRFQKGPVKGEDGVATDFVIFDK